MDDEKKNKKARFFIPVEGVLQEVGERTYRDIYQPIWAKRKQLQRSGECICPMDTLWLCDGVCPGCPHYNPQNAVFLDSTITDESGDRTTLHEVISDFSNMPEFLLLENELIEAVNKAINSLDPEEKELCTLLRRYSEYKAAQILDVPRSTLSYQWMLVKKKLKDLLKEDYFDKP